MDTASRWTVTLLLLTSTTSYCRVVTSHSSTEASSTTTPEPSTKYHSITEDLEKTHVLGPEDEDEDIFEILHSTRQPHVSVQIPTVDPDTEDDDDDTADLTPPEASTEKPAGIGLLIISIIHSVRDPPIRSQTTTQPDNDDAVDSADNQMSNHDLQTSNNFMYPQYHQSFYPYYSQPYAFNSPYFSSYPSNSYHNWPRYSNENRLAHLF